LSADFEKKKFLNYALTVPLFGNKDQEKENKVIVKLKEYFGLRKCIDILE
jgi:hypothetical protein